MFRGKNRIGIWPVGWDKVGFSSLNKDDNTNEEKLECPFETCREYLCMLRDGSLAIDNSGHCVGCGKTPEEAFGHLGTRMVGWLPDRVVRMFGHADSAVLANVLKFQVEDFLGAEGNGNKYLGFFRRRKKSEIHRGESE